MKTKITNISPDQNIIEHESGLKTVFVEVGRCFDCIYDTLLPTYCHLIPCDAFMRINEDMGNFIKLTDHENN